MTFVEPASAAVTVSRLISASKNLVFTDVLLVYSSNPDSAHLFVGLVVLFG
jgi:hypothetical protein